jgi:uncharacterized membrane protein YcaP (DUF421 family)
MKPEEIHLTDLQRILIGEIPGHFFIEIIFRALFVYLLLVITMRLMGKRMSSQISRNEMAAVASLAAAVGIPLMNPDRGLLPGLIITIVIIFFQVLIAKRAARNEKFEAITQDKLSILVKDGVIDFKNMQKTRITRERLFAQLRSQQQTNLGNVARLYLEANGLFSMVPAVQQKPGLCLLPKFDEAFIKKMTIEEGLCVCNRCGYLADEALRTDQKQCPVCQKKDWTAAVKSADQEDEQQEQNSGKTGADEWAVSWP